MINTFTAGNHILRKALQISMHEMAVLAEITNLSWNTKTGGWCVKSRASIAEYIDLSVRTVQEIMKTLYYKGYIEYPDDLGISDPRVRCTSIILEIRDSTDIGFIVKDASGKYVLASTSFFNELRRVNPNFDEEAFKKHLGGGVKKLHASHFSQGEKNVQGGGENVAGGAESAYINTPLNYNINNSSLSPIGDSAHSCDSIAKSDAGACSNNSDNVSFESIAKSDTFACSDNSRSASNDTLAHGNHMAARVSEKMYVPTEAKAAPRPDAPPRATDPRHAELEKMFEEFRIAYRKANGNVGGFQVEFDHLKKKHPKKWHEIIPTLLEKFNDQLEQRRLQKLEEGFTPQLPMLKRYVNEQMWDRHYYTSQGIPTSAAPKLHYTPSLPQFTEDQLK